MRTLYLVYLPANTADAESVAGAVELMQGLYLIRTDQTRSQLYHGIKTMLDPDWLLVATLSDLPKFKGMKAGTTKAARRLE